jgi:hypothetical protein
MRFKTSFIGGRTTRQPVAAESITIGAVEDKATCGG